MGRSILLLGIGGFAGSVLRYLVSVLFAGYVNSSFPFATMTVNVLGCFLIGLLFAVTERGQLVSPEWRIFLTTGFCGGFTTFSAYSIESVGLIQKGDYFYAAAYIVVSVAVGFAATTLGIALVRAI